MANKIELNLHQLKSLLGGTRLPGWDDSLFFHEVLHLTNLQINFILYINFCDVNYMNNNDGHI